MCNNVLEVLYHFAKFGGARISPAAHTRRQGGQKRRAAKNIEFLSAALRAAQAAGI